MVTCGFHSLSLFPALCGMIPFSVAYIKSVNGRGAGRQGEGSHPGPQHPSYCCLAPDAWLNFDSKLSRDSRRPKPTFPAQPRSNEESGSFPTLKR